jgi:hypothetical protein
MGREQLQAQLAAAQKFLDDRMFDRAAMAAAAALEVEPNSYDGRV